MKDNCAERIAKLEAFLEKASIDKDEMRQVILKLTEQVAELRVKVEFLEEENEYLNNLRGGKKKIN
jgi:hypothetical protein